MYSLLLNIQQMDTLRYSYCTASTSAAAARFSLLYWTVLITCVRLTVSTKLDEKIERVSGLQDELHLLRDLLVEYDTAARPVVNSSEVVELTMGVALFQIRELDEKNQFLQVNVWFQFHWVDPHLVWNKTLYGGLTRIHIPSSRIWIPDVVLYNSVDETKAATQIFPETNAIVSDTGQVLWTIPSMTKSSCKIDVTYFPFDRQRCPLKFGSWTYDGFQLDLKNIKETGDLSKYTLSGEWDLIGMPAVRNVDFYTCCVEPYVDVTYTIIIHRKPMFFTYNLVFPCVLLMGIGILVFCLPPESGEKVSLGVTVLLAMTVYQLLIAETIPATSEVVPLIGQFFGATIFLLSLSTAMTVLIMKLHFSGEHGIQVPVWIRRLVLVRLATLVRLNKTTGHSYPEKDYHCGSRVGSGRISLLSHVSSTDGSRSSGSTDFLPFHGSRSRVNGVDSVDLGKLHCGSPCRIRPSRDLGLQKQQRRFLLQQIDVVDSGDTYGVLCELLTQVKQIGADLQENHRSAEVDDLHKSEWRKVALVLDRLLLIAFFIVTCVTCGTIFINVPTSD